MFLFFTDSVKLWYVTLIPKAETNKNIRPQYMTFCTLTRIRAEMRYHTNRQVYNTGEEINWRFVCGNHSYRRYMSIFLVEIPEGFLLGEHYFNKRPGCWSYVMIPDYYHKTSHSDNLSTTWTSVNVPNFTKRHILTMCPLPERQWMYLISQKSHSDNLSTTWTSVNVPNFTKL